MCTIQADFVKSPGSLHILLVEDNPVDVFLVQEMLLSAGLPVAAIPNVYMAKDAASFLKTTEVDLVLLDLTLPGSHGIESYTIVRDANPSIPVIILTGNSDSSIALEALKYGAQDFLVKGEFNESMLKRSITYSIERKKFEEALKESEARFSRHVAEYERMKRIEVTKATIAAQESERKAIGEELHDNINQILSSVKIYMEVAMADPAGSYPLLEKSHEQICNAIKEIRYLSNQLIAPGEQLLELSDMIMQTANEMFLVKGIEFDIDLDNFNANTLSPDQRIAIFRIVQEQFNNIIKHSKANKVSMKMENVSDSIHLSICDNGNGVDLTVKHSGLGLKNINSRVELFNGNVSVDSAPGKGFSLKAKMDLVKQSI